MLPLYLSLSYNFTTFGLMKYLENTPQPFNITIVGVQANFRVSYPIPVISRVECIDYIRKGVLNSHLGSNPDPCYIQNRVIMKCFTNMKRDLMKFIHANKDNYHYILKLICTKKIGLQQ